MELILLNLMFMEEIVRKLLKPFKYIQDNYPGSRYFNDSLLYTGLIYANRKDYSSAKKYLNLLSKSDPDDKVWDANYIKWVTPQVATKHYSDLMKNTGQNTKDRKLNNQGSGGTLKKEKKDKKNKKKSKNLAKPINIDNASENNKIASSISLEQFDNQEADSVLNSDLINSYSDTFEESFEQDLENNITRQQETDEKNQELTTESYLEKDNPKENSANLFDSTDLSDLSDL